MREGIYRGDDGNAVYVSASGKAYDLDAGFTIPIEMVDTQDFIREAEEEDADMAASDEDNWY